MIVATPPRAVHRQTISSLDSPYTNGHTNGYTNGHANGHSNGHANGHSPPLSPKAPSHVSSAKNHALFTWHRDVREYLPPVLRRFFGYREPGEHAPFPPLPFPPFTWIARLPLKYEVWLLSFIGSFVGMALIEIVMIAAFADKGVLMIVASFGASAVLAFATIDSPLAQPRHLVGGQVVSAIAGVAVTRLFRHASGYRLEETTVHGDLGHVVWINGALAMAAALLAMQITGTTHPPGGATALIASTLPAGVAMSWRLVYIVIISGLLMLGWAMVINNVGRRRYPTYWFSGDLLFVKTTHHRITQDELHMAAVEGRSDGFAQMDRVMSNPVPDDEKPPLSRRGSIGSLRSFAERRRSHSPLSMRRSHSPVSTTRQRSHSPIATWGPGHSPTISQDASRMAALEGRNDGFAQMDRVMSERSYMSARTSRSRSPTITRDANRMAALEGRNDGFAQMERVMSQGSYTDQ